MACAIVLAGGRARRLGGDKAGAILRGRPLIEHVLDAARDAGLEPIVVAKAATPLPPVGARVVREPDAPVHPLCGILAGLRAIDGDAAVCCPLDMPFVTGDLLRWIAELPDELAVVRGHPLLGRYARALAPALEP